MKDDSLTSKAQPEADQIRLLFDRIAPQYDQMNQDMSLGLHRVWKQMAVRWSGAAAGHEVPGYVLWEWRPGCCCWPGRWG